MTETQAASDVVRLGAASRPLWTLEEVMAYTGLTESGIRQRMTYRGFPRAIGAVPGKLTLGPKFWDKLAVLDHLATLPVRSPNRRSSGSRAHMQPRKPQKHRPPNFNAALGQLVADVEKGVGASAARIIADGRVDHTPYELHDLLRLTSLPNLSAVHARMAVGKFPRAMGFRQSKGKRAIYWNPLRWDRAVVDEFISTGAMPTPPAPPPEPETVQETPDRMVDEHFAVRFPAGVAPEPVALSITVDWGATLQGVPTPVLAAELERRLRTQADALAGDAAVIAASLAIAAAILLRSSHPWWGVYAAILLLAAW